MSRDIDARFAPKDPVVERLQASRDIAHAELKTERAKVAELQAELQRARRCLASSRLAHDLATKQWSEEREAMQFKLNFAAEYIRKRRESQGA